MFPNFQILMLLGHCGALLLQLWFRTGQTAIISHIKTEETQFQTVHSQSDIDCRPSGSSSYMFRNCYSNRQLQSVAHQWRTLPTPTSAATLAEEFTLALLLCISPTRTQTCCAHQHQGEIAQLSWWKCSECGAQNRGPKTITLCQFVAAWVVLCLLLPFVVTFFWHVNRQSHFSNSCTHSLLCICLRHWLIHTRTHTRTHTRDWMKGA